MRETATKHASEGDADRRDKLLREKAMLLRPERRARYDTFARDADDARDMTIEKGIEIDGETASNQKATPAFAAGCRLMYQPFAIVEFRLYPGIRAT
ncbi:hypothetical protein [Natrinema amylolyticum]|uniref:hypothetical protein n=1 Tax=Natrinema amylolyticum TaxID=2878679 RepID=UPI001CF9C12B|nr:hypothetical protein [Natrinema amylolyticum]